MTTDTRTTLNLPAEMTRAIDNYWHAEQLRSRNEAIRELLVYALNQKLLDMVHDSHTAREGAAARLTMSDDDRERSLRMALMEAQMQKIAFDLEAWKAEQAVREKQLRRSTWSIILAGGALVVGAFAAGATWWNYLHH